MRLALLALLALLPAAALASCAAPAAPVPAVEGGLPPGSRVQHGEPLGGKRTSGAHTHHVAFAFGLVAGTEGDAARWGVEYEQGFLEEWGLLPETFGFGVLAEINANPLDEFLVAPQLTYHPEPRMRLVVAPGHAWREGGGGEWLVRTGAAWEFELDHHWSLAPEFFIDFREAGERNAVLALALGYGF
jgi:hypothetical protein